MPLFFFSIDWIALWEIIIGMILAFLVKRFLFSSPIPSLSFSFLENLQINPTTRMKWVHLPTYFQQIALFCFALAFIDPYLMIHRNFIPSKDQKKPPQTAPSYTEGIALYLLLDQSGSMSATITAKNTAGITQSISKIELAKEVTQQFIENQPSNLIGLVAFARIPHVLAPLTLDHELIQEKLNELQVVKTQEEDGTGIGYAIFKTAHLITATRHFAKDLQGKGLPPYEIKGAAIIIITDGFQDPNRLDRGNRLRTLELDEAANYAKNEDIRLYIINIDPQFSSLPDFAPHRRQMIRIAEETGGKFYLISEEKNLKEIYQTIDQLEKGKIETEGTITSTSLKENQKRNLNKNYKKISFYPFLIGCGLLFLFISMMLDTTLLRKAP
jgi:Ca-activated chloride channel family protein